MISFKAASVHPATEVLATTDGANYLQQMISAPPRLDRNYQKVGGELRAIEASSNHGLRVVHGLPINSLVSSAFSAYKSHYPYTLNPDVIWITLTQGLANHINQNAETLRKKFVKHEGQLEITVRRDHFIRGSDKNDWPGAFSEFSAKIQEHIGAKTHQNIVTDYSTTTPLACAASEIVLMDAMKAYFKYRMRTMCGIPEFHIEGTVDDWRIMRERIATWANYGLADWVLAVDKILEQIIDTYAGKVNTDFWNAFFKEDGGSGGPYVSGWITWLFPYLDSGNTLRMNTHIGKTSGHITTDSFPSSLSKTLFVWEYFTQEFKYEFIAGLTGFTQAEDLSIHPLLGWGIAEQ